MTVRTRFAPSPTGYLHVGGVRTALFNWGFARHSQGEFFLRIDDTDYAREVLDATDKIIEDLQWIGMDWDDWSQGFSGETGKYKNIMFQSAQARSHDAAIHNLVRDDYAYYDYHTKEELALRAQGDILRRRNCNPTAESNRWVIRLDVDKVVEKCLAGHPKTVIHFEDSIVGLVSKAACQIPDFVIAREDGSPLYNLATVCDDHALRITHVIRGQEHIDNTFPQILLYLALGFDIPIFAHIPFICAPNTSTKLSKRDNIPVTLESYRQQGYFPEALFTYLTHLGWSLDDKTELWTKETFVENFTLERCQKSSAQFDPEKLLWVQSEIMRESAALTKYTLCKPFLSLPDGETTQRKLLDIIHAADHRIKRGIDAQAYQHFFEKDVEIQPDAAKHIEKVGVQVLSDYRAVLGDLRENENEWTAKELERCLQEWCSAMGVKKRDLIHALRAATTGSTTGLGLFDTLELLGKETVIHRLDVVTGATNESK